MDPLHAVDWICDDGGLHWTGDPCDCPPDDDDEEVN
jgi:hypothetical protein